MIRTRPDFLVLALDLGSSSVRAALFDDTATLAAETLSQRRYAIHYTIDGGAELPPETLRRAARACVAETLRLRSQSPHLHQVPVRVLSGCSFWHSLLGLGRDGRPITPVYTWADSRSEPDAARLRSEFSEREIQLRTGCMLRAPFWPAKLRWLRRTEPALFKKVARWTSPAVWIGRDLFGIETTSHSMASGTGAYSLQSQAWDSQLCDALGIRATQLGPIDDAPVVGRKVPRALRGAAIFSPLGDGAASNVGSGADTEGRIAINIGTSAAVRTVESRAEAASTDLPFGLFRYVLDAQRTLLGGAISNAGNLRQWCMRELNFKDENAAERTLSRRASASDSITVLPFWVTERAPTWPAGLYGVIAGLAQTTTAGDIFRAVTTSTYYRLADILTEIEKAVGARRTDVVVSGGVLRSPASLQLLADCLGRDIHVSREMESSLRGAAIHAIEQLGETVGALSVEKLVRHHAKRAEQHRCGRERQRAAERIFAAGSEALRT